MGLKKSKHVILSFANQSLALQCGFEIKSSHMWHIIGSIGSHLLPTGEGVEWEILDGWRRYSGILRNYLSTSRDRTKESFPKWTIIHPDDIPSSDIITDDFWASLLVNIRHYSLEIKAYLIRSEHSELASEMLCLTQENQTSANNLWTSVKLKSRTKFYSPGPLPPVRHCSPRWGRGSLISAYGRGQRNPHAYSFILSWLYLWT